MSEPLPPCGLYRTTAAIGPIPAGRLVYFHDHGDPGPGLYLPDAWQANRAVFGKKGVTLPDAASAKSLRPLLAEGLYRVEEEFFCCEKRCKTFARDLLVQLGYDGAAKPILFVPEWTAGGLAFPQLGQGVDELKLSKLGWLVVPTAKGEPPADRH